MRPALFCASLALLALGLGLSPSSAAAAEILPQIAQDFPDLKDTLEKGLKARLPAEFTFISRVVALVNNGSLPREMVLGTFGWARRQNQKHPFRYFERALRLQAEKIGVEI